jgi:flagellar protein FlaI
MRIKIKRRTEIIKGDTKSDLNHNLFTGARRITPELTYEMLQENLEILKVYPLNEPYAHAAIGRDPETHQTRYIVFEPQLSALEQKLLEKIRTILMEELTISLSEIGSREEAERFLRRQIDKFLKTYKISTEKADMEKILYYLVRDSVYYGKIDPLLRDHLIEDISCDGVNIPIYIWHREFESVPTNILFTSADELDGFVMKLAYICGRHISIATPIIDASLPDGSRIQMTYGREVTMKGSTFTIRKFRADPLTIIDLILFNAVSSDMASYLWYCIENKSSVMVAGGVASGKTTLLNCLSAFIRPELKIVSIEDTPELNIAHENWIQGVTRTGFGISNNSEHGEITLFDLLKASLRQRPDYILVGEIRGAEANTLFQAMATGHLGMCTIHADSVDAVIHRLESEPMNIPRTLLTTMDLIAIQAKIRLPERSIRRVILITEMVGLDPHTNELLTNVSYRWEPRYDTFSFSGRSYMIERIMKSTGRTYDEVTEELKRRKAVLEWTAKNNIRNFREVTKIIRQYYADPETLYKKAVLGVELSVEEKKF